MMDIAKVIAELGAERGVCLNGVLARDHRERNLLSTRVVGTYKPHSAGPLLFAGPRVTRAPPESRFPNKNSEQIQCCDLLRCLLSFFPGRS